jgi:hypothetical protein
MPDITDVARALLEWTVDRKMIVLALYMFITEMGMKGGGRFRARAGAGRSEVWYAGTVRRCDGILPVVSNS